MFLLGYLAECSFHHELEVCYVLIWVPIASTYYVLCYVLSAFEKRLRAGLV